MSARRCSRDRILSTIPEAIAAIVPDEELRDDYIIPSVFNRDVADAVAAAVAERAKSSGDATAEHEIGFAPADSERVRAT